MALDPLGGSFRAKAPANLDYAASTPLRPAALAAMADYDESDLAGVNPNSLHSLGRAAAARLEGARGQVAATLGRGVRASEVAFTGGGSEANHLALIGISEGIRERDRSRERVIVSAIEHDSILDNLPELRRRGFRTDVVRPRRDGVVHPEDLEALMGDDVALVSIMAANNETGAVQPVGRLAEVAHAHGARFHTDAIQAWLHIPLDAPALGIDALSIAGHKVGAPVGIGALLVRGRTPISPVARGGGQERGLRPGTQDLRAILALAAVAAELHPHVDAERARVQEMADHLYTALTSLERVNPTLPDVLAADRLPGIVSLYVEGIDSQELVLKLDQTGFEVSAGSACSSGSLDASHVLTAMGIPREDALGSLRISFDDRVDPADLVGVAEALNALVGE